MLRRTVVLVLRNGARLDHRPARLGRHEGVNFPGVHYISRQGKRRLHKAGIETRKRSVSFGESLMHRRSHTVSSMQADYVTGTVAGGTLM